MKIFPPLGIEPWAIKMVAEAIRKNSIRDIRNFLFNSNVDCVHRLFLGRYQPGRFHPSRPLHDP